MHKDAPQAVQLILAGYKIQAGKVYIECLYQVAEIVYMNIYVTYGQDFTVKVEGYTKCGGEWQGLRYFGTSSARLTNN